jgi:hypothetical protein
MDDSQAVAKPDRNRRPAYPAGCPMGSRLYLECGPIRFNPLVTCGIYFAGGANRAIFILHLNLS